MPNITEYTNPVNGLSPTETGIEATAQAARRAGQFFNQAASAGQEVGDQFARNLDTSIQDAGRAAVDYEDHQQISHGAAAMAAFTQQQTQAWDNRVKGYTDADGTVHPPADPNDPQTASKFMADMEPDFDKLRGGFWTEKSQAWAEAHIESLRDHFVTKTTADMGRLAAEAVSVNYRQTANALSNTAMMSPDAVPDLLNQAKAGIAGIVGSAPNLRGADAAGATTKLTEATLEQIVKAGAIGAIRKAADPEAEADKWVQKYPQYINGQEANQATVEARMQIRFNNMEQRAQAALDKAAKLERANKAADNLELDTTKLDSNGQPVPTIPPNYKDRLNDLRDAGAPPGRISALITRGESIAKNQDEATARNVAEASRHTQADISAKINNHEITDPAQIDKIYADGKGNTLTWEAAQQLKKNLIDDKSAAGQPLAQRRSEVIKTMEPILDPARTVAGNRSPAGSVAVDRYQQALRDKEREVARQGKDPQSIYEYDKDGNSIARTLARSFTVSLMDATRSKITAMRGGGNLTGDGKTVTGVSVEDAPGAAYRVNGELRIKVGGREYRVKE